MDAPIHFEIVGRRAVYRPVAEVSLSRAIAMVNDALAFARERDCRELLMVITGLTGFPSPSITDRFYFVQEWARTAGGRVRLAVVARAELIDPQRFGVTVARNHGLIGDIFVSEDEAVAWLDGRDQAG